MKKQSILKVVNPLLALAFLWVVGTAALHSLSHDLIPYAIYARVHPIGGYVFAALALTHIVLNWNWIKANFLKKKNEA
jgi:hypothetical protein